MSGYSRTQKNDVRAASFLMLKAGRASPYKSIATLPSREALCVHEMDKVGVINADTQQQWVENDTRKRQYLDFESKKFNNVSLNFCDLENFIIEHPIDFLNADMESTITDRLGNWFEKTVAPSFISGGDIIVTVTKWARNNPIHDWLVENIDSTIISEQVKDLRVRLNNDDPGIIVPLSILFCALQIEMVDRITVFDYGDKSHTKMASIVLQNIVVGNSQWPLFSDLIQSCDVIRNQRKKYEKHSSDALKTIQDELALEFKTASEEGDKWIVTMSKKVNCVTRIGEYNSLKELAYHFQIEIN